MDKDLLRLIISSCIWGYVFLKYMDTIYTRKYSKDIMYLCYYIIFVIISFVSNILGVPFLNSITIYALFMLGSCMLYRDKGKAFVLYNSFFMLFMIFLEIISVVLLTDIISIEVNSVLSNKVYMNITDIPVLFLGIVLCPVIAKIFKKQKISEITIRENILIVILLAIQLGIISYISNLEEYNNTFATVITVSFIVIDAFIIKIFRYASAAYEYKKKNSFLERENIMSIYYYQKAEDDFNRTRKISHDIKRHLAVLKGMLDEKNSQDVVEYIDGVEAHLDECKIDFHFKNKILNLIINQKYQLCKSKEIELKLYIQDLELDFMDNYDITTIISNLIDNAIDESIDVETDPYIEVRLFELNNILNILVKNRSVEKKSKTCKIGVSSKENHEGLGLVNIRETVLKYHGDMKILSEDSFFSVYINIPVI